MAMTCDVRPEVRQDIPAVTHIDGTARPQIITSELNPQLYAVMLEYQKLTGCGVMVNTSFNMHEEPINYTLADSIRALRLEGVDVLYTKDCRLSIV
jgi:carbamoyltransferase